MLMEQIVRSEPAVRFCLTAENIIPHTDTRHLVLDGYFGHNNALQMTKQCGLELISKLRLNTALYFPSTMPYAGRGRPRLYGQRFNPQQIDPKWRISTETHGNITTEVYQAQLRHKKFPDPLNVVCILTQLMTQRRIRQDPLESQRVYLLAVFDGQCVCETSRTLSLDLKARYRGMKYFTKL